MSRCPRPIEAPPSKRNTAHLVALTHETVPVTPTHGTVPIPPGAYQSPFYQPAQVPPPRDNTARKKFLVIGGVVFAALTVIGTIATVLNPAELRQALATSPVATRSAVAKVTPAPSRHHTGRHKPSKAVRAAKRIVTWYTGAGGGELHAVDAQLAAMVRAGRSGNFAAEGPGLRQARHCRRRRPGGARHSRHQGWPVLRHDAVAVRGSGDRMPGRGSLPGRGHDRESCRPRDAGTRDLSRVAERINAIADAVP